MLYLLDHMTTTESSTPDPARTTAKGTEGTYSSTPPADCGMYNLIVTLLYPRLKKGGIIFMICVHLSVRVWRCSCVRPSVCPTIGIQCVLAIVKYIALTYGMWLSSRGLQIKF